MRVLTINRGNTAPTPSTPIVGTPDPVTSAVNVTLTFEDTDGDLHLTAGHSPPAAPSPTAASVSTSSHRIRPLVIWRPHSWPR